MAATSYLSNLFSFLSISKSSPIHHDSASLNLNLLPKSQPAPLITTFDPVTSSSSSESFDSSRIAYPSLAFSNVFFFKSAYNVQVIVGENEPEEKLLNRFRREVLKAGVIQECKRRRFFENKQAKVKRKARDAAKRRSKRWIKRPDLIAQEQLKQEIPQKNKGEEDDDNWDFYQVEVPYVHKSPLA